MELTDKKWDLFHLYDFSTISMGNKMDYSKMHTDNPSVNFVGRSANDNGIKGAVDIVMMQNEDGSYSPVQPYSAGSITIALGGSIGSTYVQNKDFYTSQNVAVLEFANNISNLAKWFICGMVKKECEQKYCAFGRELNSHLRTDFTIPLPIDANGNPDWDWIEQYMKSLEEGLDDQMNDIMKVADGDKNIIKVFADKVEIDDFKAWLQDNANMDADHQMSLDDVTWGTFKLTDVFTRIEPTKGKTTNSLEDGNDVMYIAAAHNLQGFNRFCSSDNVEDWISKGNCIIFVNLGDGSAGYANYMGEDFIGMSGKTSVGYIDGIMTPNIGKFLETILCQERFRYGHERSWAGERLTNTKIQLPVDANGNPDWDWIEQYMKSLPYSDKEVEVA